VGSRREEGASLININHSLTSARDGRVPGFDNRIRWCTRLTLTSYPQLHTRCTHPHTHTYCICVYMHNVLEVCVCVFMYLRRGIYMCECQPCGLGLRQCDKYKHGFERRARMSRRHYQLAHHQRVLTKHNAP
jgi:hypothetical protein